MMMNDRIGKEQGKGEGRRSALGRCCIEERRSNSKVAVGEQEQALMGFHLQVPLRSFPSQFTCRN